MNTSENRLKEIFGINRYYPKNSPEDKNSFERTLKIYLKQGYTLDDSFQNFIKLSNGEIITRLLPNGQKDTLSFDIKRMFIQFPKNIIDSLEKKYSLKNIVPFAIMRGKSVFIAKDENNNVYALCESYMSLFGKSILEGIENIIADNEIERINI